jgi:DUF218 domain
MLFRMNVDEVLFVASTANQRLDIIHDEYAECFDLSDRIYTDKRPEWNDLFDKNRMLASDIAASVATALFRGGFMKNQHFVERMLRCCANTVSALGFDEIEKQSFIHAMHAAEANVVLVLGCQDERMLQRRVDRLVELAMHTSSPFAIVFSGYNPGTPTVRIKDESTRMRILFENAMERRFRERGLKAKDYETIMLPQRSEQNSRNTKQNLDEFLGRNYLNANLKQNVVVISSTFHLIRIAEYFSGCVAGNLHNIKKMVSRVLLVGAEKGVDEFLNEGGETPIRVHDHEFVKLMMFDLFRQHAH